MWERWEKAGGKGVGVKPSIENSVPEIIWMQKEMNLFYIFPIIMSYFCFRLPIISADKDSKASNILHHAIAQTKIKCNRGLRRDIENFC